MVDFRHLLRKPMSEVKAPPALPVGSAYRGMIVGHSFGETRPKEGKPSPLLKFQIRPMDWSPEVAEEDREGITLESRRFFKDYFLLDQDGTDAPQIQIRRLLESMGLGEQDENMEDLLPETTGKEVVFEVKQRFNERDQTTENQVGKVVGA